MPNKEQFPHIPLLWVRDAPPKTVQRPIPSPTQTSENLSNRALHHRKIEGAIQRLLEDDRLVKNDRLQQGLPSIDDHIALFLQIDGQKLKVDDLRKYDIEIIAELDDSFIIGCSPDLTLSALRKKIDKFLGGKQNDVAGLYNLNEGFGWRPEQILSPDLWERWADLRDDEIIMVDIGIACLGITSIPERPHQAAYHSEEKYRISIEKWERRYREILLSWDDLQRERSDQLRFFLSAYGFDPIDEFNENITEDIARLPDSFTCRAKITGKSLRDLTLNFQYVFDISTVDLTEIAPDASGVGGDQEIHDVTVLPPQLDAPFVCVIDSGIQENHRLLQAAIDHERSRSWIGNASDTADYVSPGGHGTRVAGAILYPREIPNSGEQQAAFWLQNVRVLDDHNGMPNILFPPKIIGDTVHEFHNGPTKTRLYNHSIASTSPCRLQKMSAWAAEIDYQSWQSIYMARMVDQ